MYSWGQFVDHDLDLVTSDGVNHIDIPVKAGDFPDVSSIPLTRSVIDPATGAEPALQPRRSTKSPAGSMPA
jgi:hypothetical protein